jgi:hypothetical protein
MSGYGDGGLDTSNDYDNNFHRSQDLHASDEGSLKDVGGGVVTVSSSQSY